MNKKEIIILGAGLVGSLLSIYLQKAGKQVTIYEKRPDPRKSNLYAGRSINLAMSVRGLRALAAVGLESEVLKMVIPMHGRQMHGIDGQLTFQPYGKEGQHINAISRAKLNELLVNEAERHGVAINFDHRCDEVNFAENKVLINAHGKTDWVTADLLVGADGAFSAMRKAMLVTDRFSFSQYYIEHGYKELTIPATILATIPEKNGQFAMAPEALHIWPRGKFMLIALPNQDKSFTCTLFFPFEGKPSFESLHSREEIEAFFHTYFPDIVQLIPDYIAQYQTNPTSSLVTIMCYPWVKGRSILLGDASHAIVPFYGQGMNAGFEDCYLFAEMAKELRYQWDEVLQKFQKSRKKDADAIATLALQNFIEMRDSVADDRFLFQKKIEAQLHERFPTEWIPQYSLVTFSHTPYHEALEKGALQHSIMQVYITEATMKNPESIPYDNIIEELRAAEKGKV